MRTRSSLVVVVALLAAACGSPAAQPTETPASSSTAGGPATPSTVPAPTRGASLDVTPLIPELASDGTLHLLHEDGSTVGSFPASMSLELFSPLGGAFLAAPQTDGAASSLVAIQAGGSLETLQTISNPRTFAGATGALDGHAWAWLQGTTYTSPCNQGLSGGTLDVAGPGMQPRIIAQLPSGGATAAWSLGGWAGDNIWLVRTSGCAEGGRGTTTAYVAHESGGALTPVQSALGSGCALTAMSLDGSMLCTTQPANDADATWRFVGAGGSVESFSAPSLRRLCAGRGPLHDFEGLGLSLDARYISIDAGCLGTERFDQLFLIATATGAAQLVDTPTYLAAVSWLPDGTLLCEDLSNPMAAVSYLVTPGAGISRLASGTTVWSTTGVVW